MSYIHEALKKAQKERDSLSLKYSAFMAAIPRRENALGIKMLWAPLFVLVLVLLAFVVYSQVNVPSTPVAPKPSFASCGAVASSFFSAKSCRLPWRRRMNVVGI